MYKEIWFPENITFQIDKAIGFQKVTFAYIFRIYKEIENLKNLPLSITFRIYELILHPLDAWDSVPVGLTFVEYAKQRHGRNNEHDICGGRPHKQRACRVVQRLDGFVFSFLSVIVPLTPSPVETVVGAFTFQKHVLSFCVLFFHGLLHVLTFFMFLLDPRFWWLWWLKTPKSYVCDSGEYKVLFVGTKPTSRFSNSWKRGGEVLFSVSPP